MRIKVRKQDGFTVRCRSLLKVGFVSFVCDFLVCFEALLGFKSLESFVLQREQIVLKGFGCIYEQRQFRVFLDLSRFIEIC